MKINKLRLTAHAWQRLAQRGISLSDVLTAVTLGRRIHRAHADFFFFGWRDLPCGMERKLAGLVGLTVVVENDDILTAYRNKRALAKLKRKPKRYHGCPREVTKIAII